jgi:glutaminyl-tRNA synthetase
MTENKESLNFIEEIIEEDLRADVYNGRVHTRFPPEPNGYLHIGHAKSICLNFGLGQKYQGKTNLRFDDTNPAKEETEYVNSIRNDVEWLGFKWSGEYYASDYFDQLYEWAKQLIIKEKAYIDDSSAAEIKAMKGTPTLAGTESPYRNRSVEENLDLFERMKNGEFPEGARVLRAKIDMTSPNMHLRDPLMYRIKIAEHHRTGNKWNIYPMYDYAHGLSDSIEGITHSVCTLEFEVHRPLYNWFLIELGIYRPKQIEFARLNLNYTVMSKRKLLQLVEEKLVNGWDDPRMPTISALRRRGYTPESLRDFATRVGIAKRDNVIDIGFLESCVREHLNKIATRMMVILNPIKLIINDYPEGQTDFAHIENNPEDENAGSRNVLFSRELYIESDDFMENPPKGYFRLFKGGVVRLKGAYIVRCEDFVKDENGNVTEVHCSLVPNSKSGNDTSGVKCKGTIHWVSAADAIDAEVRMYDRLFTSENPAGEEDFKAHLNPNSLTINHAKAESALKNTNIGDKYQFVRKGYFCTDTDSKPEHLVFNLTVGLKDSWAKEQKKK